jgi:hypothetical protein
MPREIGQRSRSRSGDGVSRKRELSPFSADARRGGTLRFAAKLALVVIIIAVAVYLVLLSDINRVLRWRLDKLHAAGIPTKWSEVAPPPIPDKDNAAILYQEAFKRLDLERHPRHSIRDDECLRDFLADEPPGSRSTLYPRIQQVLARNQPALALIKQAGARPRCRFPLRWDQMPAAMEFRHLGPLRNCSRLLTADALVAARQGNAAEVTEACTALIRLARHTISEPTMISFLVGTREQESLSSHLPDLLPDAKLDPAMCRALSRELDRLDFDAAFRRVIIETGCETLWYFDEADRRPGAVRPLIANTFAHEESGAEGLAGRALLGPYFSPLGRLFRLKEEIVFLDRFEQRLALATKPYRMAPARWRDLEQRRGAAPFHYWITSAVAYPWNITHRDRAIACRNGMQVVLALEAYHAQRGEYPNTLAALRQYLDGASAAPETGSPVQGWKLPDDPFSGKPFVYRKQGAGFLLYSWGEDLKDDSGRPVSEPPRTSPPDGDIVWTFTK